MTPAAARGRTALIACAVAGALVVVGCGSESDSPSVAQGTTPDPSEFPEPDGRTLEELARDVANESDLVVAPASQVAHEGSNRLGFGVFTLDREPVRDAEFAIYAAQPNRAAVGPLPTTVESLDVEAAFRSRSTASDPDAADVVYATDVSFDKKGEWRLLAIFSEGDELSVTGVAPSVVVGRFDDVPSVGETAPAISTLTGDDVGGDLAKIDTRQPPSTMHDVDFSDVVGKEPVVLLFATPALCSSRVCGPVVDVAEQVKSERGDEAAFIMQEIYKDNAVDKGVREQVNAFNLPSEPWLFVIDADGKVSTAIEGAFSEAELNEALDKVTG